MHLLERGEERKNLRAWSEAQNRADGREQETQVNHLQGAAERLGFTRSGLSLKQWAQGGAVEFGELASSEEHFAERELSGRKEKEELSQYRNLNAAPTREHLLRAHLLVRRCALGGVSSASREMRWRR